MLDFMMSTASLFFAVACYLLFSFPLYVMGQKTGQDNPWFAFIPILNVVLMLQIAGKDLWWLLLLLIPLVNVIVLIIVWMGIAEAMEKPGWVGILIIVPVVNWIVPFYLAFG